MIIVILSAIGGLVFISLGAVTIFREIFTNVPEEDNP